MPHDCSVEAGWSRVRVCMAAMSRQPASPAVLADTSCCNNLVHTHHGKLSTMSALVCRRATRLWLQRMPMSASTCCAASPPSSQVQQMGW